MKILQIVLLCILFPIFSNAQTSYSEYFTDQSLRIDLEHAGNHQSSSIYIKQLTMQLRWGGCTNQLIDNFEYGNMKIEISEPKNDEIIFSKSYSSIFKEWQFTDEATLLSKSFCEPIICPMPTKTVNIKIYSRDTLLQWVEKLRFNFNPQKTIYRQVTHSNYTVDSLIYNGSPENHVDFVFIAEGYKQSQLGKFKKDVKRLTDSLFSCQPYNLFTDQFNVWVVNAISTDPGCDLPASNIWKNTAMECSFSTFGSERYLQCLQLDKMHDIIATTPVDIPIIVVNSEKYGGGAIYNLITTVTSDNEFADFILFHELGHSFAGLADEYYDSEVAYEEFYNKTLEPTEPNITTLVNFEKKWKNMVPSQIPIPTPATQKYENVIGVFEGAGYSAKGIYRPSISCSMKDSKRNNLCPVCNKTIIEIITSHIQ